MLKKISFGIIFWSCFVFNTSSLASGFYLNRMDWSSVPTEHLDKNNQTINAILDQLENYSFELQNGILLCGQQTPGACEQVDNLAVNANGFLNQYGLQSEMSFAPPSASPGGSAELVLRSISAATSGLKNSQMALNAEISRRGNSQNSTEPEMFQASGREPSSEECHQALANITPGLPLTDVQKQCKQKLAEQKKQDTSQPGTTNAQQTAKNKLENQREIICQRKGTESEFCTAASSLEAKCKDNPSTCDEAQKEMDKVAAKAGGGSGSTSGVLSEVEVEPALKESIKICQQARDRNTKCCGAGALGCAFGGDKDGGEEIGQIVGVGAQLLISMASNPYALAQECKKFQTLGTFSAGINGAMAAICHSTRTSCESTCDAEKANVESLQAACDGDAECKRKVERAVDKIENYTSNCKGSMAAAAQLAGQAGQALLANKFANICKDTVALSGPPVPPGIPGGDWCKDVSDLSNPYCLAEFCSQPGAATLPECQNVPVAQESGGNPSGSSIGGGNFGDVNGGFNLSGQEIEPNQLPQVGKVEPTANSVLANTSGGGGGGLPGSAGGAGGAPTADGGGGGGRGGYQTDILKGFSGGSGYTTAKSTGFVDGGGYSSRGGGTASNKGSKFDLKSFLPGGKDMNRKIAGLAASGARAEIAGKHEDIWMRVSNKYKEMCVLNRLYCTSTQNRGRGL